MFSVTVSVPYLRLCGLLTDQRVKDPGPAQAVRILAIYTSQLTRSRHERGVLSLETMEILVLWY